MLPKEEPIDLSKMSVEEARILIAKDALRHLDSKFLDPTHISYVYFPDHLFLGKDAQLDEVLRNSSNCSVCAIGALFVSTVLHNNAITVGEMGGGMPGSAKLGIVHYLKPYFAEEQLDMIEAAYEGWATKDKKYDGSTFMPGSSNGNVLRAILNNIIANNGIFIPTVGTSEPAQ